MTVVRQIPHVGSTPLLKQLRTVLSDLREQIVVYVSLQIYRELSKILAVSQKLLLQNLTTVYL